MPATPVAAGLVALLLAGAPPAPSEPSAGTLLVEVRAEGRPLADAVVRVGGVSVRTGAEGQARLDLAPGEHEVVVEAEGCLPALRTAAVEAGVTARMEVDLERLEEEVFVTATRSDTRLSDQPLRVEVIDREEIEEKALMTPGSVAMLLAETTGLRVQTTAPSLGAANVRIQGLRGHYTQLLADGLPLYGAQGDSFNLLQVPPLDLGQVEVIKGAASALYGPAALGGVVDLVSRRPRAPEEELLLNATTLAGIDATGWLARAGRWSWSTLGGYHRQPRRDRDGDGWTDVAGFDRGVLRPRVVFDDGRGTRLFATAGGMVEDRAGGTLPGAVAPDGEPFPESLATRRGDAGLVGRWVTADRVVLTGRGSFSGRSQDRRFGAERERSRRLTWFGEASLRAAWGRHVFVAGGAFQQDRHRHRDLPRFDYVFSAPAVFVQDEAALGDRLSAAASVRADFHSEYGTLVSPRLSLLFRPGGGWRLRLSAGTGAFAPTPFTEETDETGLTPLRPLSGIRAESARGGSIDAGYSGGGVDVTATLFGSLVRRPAGLRTVDDRSVELVNAPEPTRTWGAELVARYRSGPFLVMLTSAWTRSTELDLDTGARRGVPLIPRAEGSLNVIWEDEDHGRLGLELYYTGRQDLEDDPYRETGRPYALFGILGERRFGPVRLFLNLENLFDVRQTREAPLVRPERLPDGRWTVDAWMPLDGRVVNGGVRLVF